MIEENRLDILPPSTLIMSLIMSFDNASTLFFRWWWNLSVKDMDDKTLSRKLDKKEMIFNYCLSWARRTIGNAFAIPSALWGKFHTPIRANMENIEKYVLAYLCLQNYFPMDTSSSIRHRFDVEIPRGKFVEISSILKGEPKWK